MSATFAIPAPYRQATNGQAEVDIEAGNVREAIAALNERYPEMGRRLLNKEGKLNSYVSVYLNGEQLHGPGALDREVKDGDRLVVMPVIGGGH